MSHFTVMVIGDDPESQLAPYDENISTAPRDEGEVDEEEKQRMMDHYAEEGISLPFDELYKLKGMEWDGNSFVKHFDGTWHRYSTYNTESRWDWYQLGGRWSNFLKLKDGAEGTKGEKSWTNREKPDEPGFADAALKKDIDFDWMRNRAAESAGKMWDKANEVLKDLPVGESWETIRRRYTKNDTDYTDIDKARNEYHAQPRVLACNQHLDFASPEDFAISRGKYVENARNGAVSTFAILKDGIWFEKGNMGWWGMVSNEKDQDEWDKHISEMLDSLPDDTMISIYDCHI